MVSVLTRFPVRSKQQPESAYLRGAFKLALFRESGTANEATKPALSLRLQ